MPIIDSPPSAKQLIVRRLQRNNLPGQIPGFLRSDEMEKADGALKMSVRRYVLIISTRSAIISEAEPMPVAKMHVEQSLVSSIEADASFCESLECVVVLHIRTKNHEPTVEAVRPSYIRCGCKVYLEGQQLVGGSYGHDVAIDVDNSFELGETPKLDFGKCRNQVRAVHQQ